jgi:hypothetical protein
MGLVDLETAWVALQAITSQTCGKSAASIAIECLDNIRMTRSLILVGHFRAVWSHQWSRIGARQRILRGLAYSYLETTPMVCLRCSVVGPV